MDRVVKFRGRRLCDGRWEYGHYDKDSRGDAFIRHPDTDNPKRIDVWQVDPDTVGQFTGLYDRNGKEIYEGDIIYTDYEMDAEVYWDEYSASFSTRDEIGSNALWDSFAKTSEVVGNIHENPEPNNNPI